MNKKSRRYALNIGVSLTDEVHYDSDRAFIAGEPSANWMTTFFSGLGFTSSKLIPSKKATYAIFKSYMEEFAADLEEGDLLVITFCGHTDRIHTHYKLDRADNKDHGWVLHDRVLFHFEIWQFLQQFRSGVRVVIIADSCYSGRLSGPKRKLARSVPYHFYTFQKEYNKILKKSGKPEHNAIPPSIVVLSASRDEEQTDPPEGKEGRTVFSIAFQRAWERLNEDPKIPANTLSGLFDEIVWNIHVKIAESLDINVRAGDLTKPTIHKRRVTPQWHYYSGHLHTKIRTQSPPFKIGNN